MRCQWGHYGPPTHLVEYLGNLINLNYVKYAIAAIIIIIIKTCDVTSVLLASGLID